MGWLNAYGHRKSVTITGQAGAGTDYQVSVSIGEAAGGDFNLEGHASSFPNDIRFTDNDETTELDYWIEDLTVDPITAWVKVSDDLGSNVDVCCYYGKSGDSSASHFDNTFIFGDSLDNDTLNTNRWPSVDGNPTYSIDAENHYLEITDMDENTGVSGKGFHSKAIVLPSEWIIEDAYSSDGFEIWHNSTSNADVFASIFSLHHGTWGGADYGIGFTRISDGWGGDRYIVVYCGVGGNKDYYSGLISPAMPFSYLFKMYKLSGNIHIYEGVTERVNEANSETPNIVHLVIERHRTSSFGTKRFYAFKVRKYASPEPAFSSVGGEENAPTGAIMNQFQCSNIGADLYNGALIT